MRVGFCAVVAFWLSLAGTVVAEPSYDKGREPLPPVPFPDVYKNYQILPGTISPDHQYALIYPKRRLLYDLQDYGLFLAALKPFQVLSQLPQGNSNLAENARNYYSASWAKDSSAVVMIAGGRWGPESVSVTTLRAGKIVNFVDLTMQVRRQVTPDFQRSHTQRYNEHYDFVFDSDNRAVRDKEGEVIRESGWEPDKAERIIIDCTCTTDPKNLDPHHWAVRFKGVWDIGRRTFFKKRFTRLPFQPGLY